MTDSIYYNFDLFLEKNEDGYWVRVLDSPVGPAVAPFVMPFSARALEQFILLIGEPSQLDAQRMETKRSAVLDFGRRLFDAIFRDKVLTCLLNSLNFAVQERLRLRLRLRMSETPELARLPWEYLHAGGELGFLALSNQTPLLRFTELMHRAQSLLTEPPLRVLTVIPSPASLPPVAEARAWLNLIDSVDQLGADGKMIFERLPRPTLLDLQRRLRQGEYHILHFIGHGDYDPHGQEGYLIFEDEHGRPRPVSGQHLGGLLSDHFALRLAVINACQGAHAAVQNPFNGVAQSAVKRGLPAVVSMQFPISDPVAALFARTLYSAIADSQPIDMALVAARQAIFNNLGGIEWGMPVLFTRSPDGKLFERRAASQGGTHIRVGSVPINTTTRTRR